jgi:hypothetical protein
MKINLRMMSSRKTDTDEMSPDAIESMHVDDPKNIRYLSFSQVRFCL